MHDCHVQVLAVGGAGGRDSQNSSVARRHGGQFTCHVQVGYKQAAVANEVVQETQHVSTSTSRQSQNNSSVPRCHDPTVHCHVQVQQAVMACKVVQVDVTFHFALGRLELRGLLDNVDRVPLHHVIKDAENDVAERETAHMTAFQVIFFFNKKINKSKA